MRGFKGDMIQFGMMDGLAKQQRVFLKAFKKAKIQHYQVF
jgi:hypothetical protein